MPPDPDQRHDDQASRRRAVGIGCGLAVVAFAYGPSSLGDTERLWAAVATVIVALLLVDGISVLRSLLPEPGVAATTMCAALVAVYLCVPETDQVPVAAIVPLGVVAAELMFRRQLGIEWYALAATSVGWAAMVGATGRQSALIGALFAWWAVGLVPLVHLVQPVRSRATATAVAILGAAAAIVFARTGGVASASSTAWIAVVIVAGTSFALALATARFWPAGRAVDS